MNCVFCKIAYKKIPAEIISENGNFMVLKDIHPKAPIHLLIIPKVHIGAINTLNEKDREIVGKLILEAKKAAGKAGISKKGYRLIFNVGRGAGMEINHLHLHLLGGKPLKFSSL